MDKLTLVIFILSYGGIALGRIPGLTLDRTGIALLGAIAMIVTGALTAEQAVDAVDFPTIILLYSLMVVSAQLRLGGFYTWLILRITRLMEQPGLFLFLVMFFSAVLSALLANDIICLAFTPVLTVSLLKAKRNPVPYLMGLAISSNIGSAATIIGNPQNMLLGQVGKLDFAEFFYWCSVPSLLSLLTSFLFLFYFYRKELAGKKSISLEETIGTSWPSVNGWHSAKGIVVTLLMVVLFFFPFPREIVALALAGVLLCSRKLKSRQMLELIDWHLITLFCALFIIIQALSNTHMPEQLMNQLSEVGIDFRNLPLLILLSSTLSNLVSNVPATMLFIPFLEQGNPVEWYTLAVASTFAGNLFLIGSIANLIVVEQAAHLGCRITFKEHAKVGIPVTLISLAILLIHVYI